MAKTEIRVTVNTSDVEKTLEVIARHCNALAAELKQAREYPHGTTNDQGRPIRPDGSVIESPGHDPHSTTSASTERRSTWDVETPASPFGFGKH